ncbi:NADH-quinone oxidoreductase subunit N [Cytophagales bacterium LB-30]|uniref:NADH-quinone oxidoreductase subunit N n=1 Tax=Shiella aurantiaca TaxID=3058365 RepID=A0ABT8F958_9BACT|nr:NADH-quinone oxidoreductase subunit N [Shiella aurantiaca]MDN4167002.1 NADH-quinone oxidoreductase subunit N [Shiella aurantiaca]
MERLLPFLDSVPEALKGLLPEMLLLGGILLVLLIGMGKQIRPKLLAAVSVLVLLGYLALLLPVSIDTTQAMGLGLGVADGLGWFLRILVGAAALLTVLISLSSTEQEGSYAQQAEYYALVLAMCLAGALVAVSTHLLLLFVAIEFLSIGGYLLTQFHFTAKSAEASMKYILFGAAVSAISLFGISLLYGFTGTLDLNSYDFIRGLLSSASLPVLLAAFLVIGGMLFKMAAVPYHFWMPDVLSHTPVPIAALLATLPKLAVLGILVRLVKRLDDVSLIFVDAAVDWQAILAVIALLTLLVGNLAALYQTQLKRLLAYSSIAHVGFLLAAIACFSSLGIQSLLFYGLMYVIATYAAFLMSRSADTHQLILIKDLTAVGRTHPWQGVLWTITVMALIGLPPSLGFTAKVLVFSALWESIQNYYHPWLWALLLVSIGATVLSLFYYLRIPYYLYFKGPAIHLSGNKMSKIDIWIGTFLCFLLLLGFLMPNGLLELIYRVKFAF